MPSEEYRVLANNRKARHDYTITDTFEAGIVLTGTEIKSLRAGQVSLREGYVVVRNNELWLLNVHIAVYDQAGSWSHDPLRPRKLLMHRRQINNLYSLLQEKGYTIVPLRLYLKGNIAKVEIGLAKGKRQYDKRQAISARDEERKLRREWKEYSKNQY
jgi:SsrA-binding protein